MVISDFTSGVVAGTAPMSSFLLLPQRKHIKIGCGAVKSMDARISTEWRLRAGRVAETCTGPCRGKNMVNQVSCWKRYRRLVSIASHRDTRGRVTVKSQRHDKQRTESTFSNLLVPS